MYKVFKDCEQIAIIEKPVYIKCLSDGTFTPATEADCQGIAINSVPYNLFGCSAMDGVTDTVVLCECDGGIEIAKIADSLPGDVISELSRFQNCLGNEYVWAKGTYVEEFNVGSFVYDSINVQTTTWNAQTMVYSDTPDMQNAQSVSVSYDTYQNANVLAGKFFYKEGDPSIVYYGEPDTIAGRSSASNLYRVELSFSLTWAVVTKFKTVGYVNSPDPAAYPVDDGYTYTALGQLGAKVQIATGSYTGTGTSGASNPNSLTFDFIPKFVFVSAGNGLVVEPYLWGAASYAVQYNSQTKDNSVTISGSTMSWYSSVDAQRQLNLRGTTYRYIAIG